MLTIGKRSAAAAASVMAAGLLVACTAAEAEEPSPAPSGSTPESSPSRSAAGAYADYAAEDRELLELLADFRPSDDLLEAHGLEVLVVSDPITAEELAEYQWVVEPAGCAPVLNALKNQTTEDLTTRGDDSLIKMIGLYASPASATTVEIYVQARIFDDGAAASGFVDDARESTACTNFVEKDPSGEFPDVHASVAVSSWELPGLDGPAAIADVTIDEECAPATDACTPVGFRDWNSFASVDRVWLQVKVQELDDPRPVAQDLFNELATYLDGATA